MKARSSSTAPTATGPFLIHNKNFPTMVRSRCAERERERERIHAFFWWVDAVSRPNDPGRSERASERDARAALAGRVGRCSGVDKAGKHKVRNDQIHSKKGSRSPNMRHGLEYWVILRKWFRHGWSRLFTAGRSHKHAPGRCPAARRGLCANRLGLCAVREKGLPH